LRNRYAEQAGVSKWGKTAEMGFLSAQDRDGTAIYLTEIFMLCKKS